METIKANNLTDCYVRPLTWRGSEQMGVAAQHAKIHLAIAAWDWGYLLPDGAAPEGHPDHDRQISPPRPGHGASCHEGRGLIT